MPALSEAEGCLQNGRVTLSPPWERAGGREREAGAPLYKEEELKRAPAGQVASSLLERLIFEPLAVQGDLATIFSLASLDLFHVE